MRKLLLLALCFVLLLTSSVFGATLNLKATWTPNTEPDMKEYRLYRTDVPRVLIDTISHPPTLPYLFSITVPDGSSGVLSFVLTAVDTNNNESLDSNIASLSYNLDATPPMKPGTLGVTF